MLDTLAITSWLDRIPEGWLPWGILVVGALAALLIVRGAARSVGRLFRRRGSGQIHPRLQKYNIDHAELDRRRREQARAITATSTGQRLAGFRIVRQIDAVFVDGYRSPEEAMIALKADAAERGANALLNVTTERTAAGRCTASGDAVLAEAIAPKAPPPPTSPGP